MRSRGVGMGLAFVAGVALAFTAATGASEPKKRDTAAEASGDPGDKLICKRFTETGSLVAKKKTCKTKREWERDRDVIRQQITSGGGVCNAPGGGAC